MYIYTYIQIHTHTCVCVRVCVRVCVCVCVCVYTYIRIHTYIYIYVYVYVYDRFEEFRETTIDESGAKTPLYPVPKGFPHNVKSRKSLEDRMLRFYAKMHASKGRVGRDRGGEEGRESPSPPPLRILLHDYLAVGAWSRMRMLTMEMSSKGLSSLLVLTFSINCTTSMPLTHLV